MWADAALVAIPDGLVPQPTTLLPFAGSSVGDAVVDQPQPWACVHPRLRSSQDHVDHLVRPWGLPRSGSCRISDRTVGANAVVDGDGAVGPEGQRPPGRSYSSQVRASGQTPAAGVLDGLGDGDPDGDGLTVGDVEVVGLADVVGGLLQRAGLEELPVGYGPSLSVGASRGAPGNSLVEAWTPESMATRKGPAGLVCWQDASSSPVAMTNADRRAVPIVMSRCYAGHWVDELAWNRQTRTPYTGIGLSPGA